jgi:pectinesterase
MWFRPGEHPSVPKGRKDNTHYNVYGATVVAGLLAEEISHQVPALKKKMDIKKIKKLKKRLK